MCAHHGEICRVCAYVLPTVSDGAAPSHIISDSHVSNPIVASGLIGSGSVRLTTEERCV